MLLSGGVIQLLSIQNVCVCDSCIHASPRLFIYLQMCPEVYTAFHRAALYRITQQLRHGGGAVVSALASQSEGCGFDVRNSPGRPLCFPPQIPYLGFCSCEEQGDTGVWQLVDPPILPLTHGPNHTFDWRETLLQE